jgi:hypothetical protein
MSASASLLFIQPSVIYCKGSSPLSISSVVWPLAFCVLYELCWLLLLELYWLNVI